MDLLCCDILVTAIMKPLHSFKRTKIWLYYYFYESVIFLSQKREKKMHSKLKFLCMQGDLPYQKRPIGLLGSRWSLLSAHTLK